MTRSRDIADQQKNLGGAVAPFAAGKNKIINGDFFINQRNFSSTTSSGTYGFDRWLWNGSGGTGTYSAQTFTLGTAPVAGYEAKNFARVAVTTGNDFCGLRQLVESVRTFAGQTVTLSFWAKGTNPTTEGGLYAAITQNFGTGGTPSANVDLVSSKFVLTSDWQRFSFTFNLASIAGKTLGTNNNDCIIPQIGQWTSTSTDAWTLDIWGVQLEAGSVATAFQTATGTLQGELAACQRYYYRAKSDYAYAPYAIGVAYSTTAAVFNPTLPVTMRVAPTSIDYAGLFVNLYAIGGSTFTTLAISSSSEATPNVVNLIATGASGLTQFRPYQLMNNGTTSGYLGFNAEL